MLELVEKQLDMSVFCELSCRSGMKMDVEKGRHEEKNTVFDQLSKQEPCLNDGCSPKGRRDKTDLARCTTAEETAER
jgi:hypothetical protein